MNLNLLLLYLATRRDKGEDDLLPLLLLASAGGLGATAPGASPPVTPVPVPPSVAGVGGTDLLMLALLLGRGGRLFGRSSERRRARTEEEDCETEPKVL